MALGRPRGASEVAGTGTGTGAGTGLEQALRATLTVALDDGDFETAAGLVALLKARFGGR